METMLKLILSLSLGGTLLGALLMLLRRILKNRIPSGFYYYAWLIVLLRFVLPLPGLLPTRAAPAAPAPVTTLSAAPLSPAADTSGGARHYNADQVGAFTPRSEAEIPESSAATAPTAEKTPVDWAALGAKALALLRSWNFWGGVYLAGCAFSALWYFGGYACFRHRLVRLFKPARDTDYEILRTLHGGSRPQLRRSRLVRTPLLLGLFRPVIVLPDRSYSPEQLGGILRHELTHYERGDLVYKWFAVAVFLFHWFNPFTALFRRELDRACELSCDERLLRRMGQGEKQSYGELLLSMAADRPLPGSVVAMSFATEKRNLKERLVQIMTYKKSGKAGIAVMLAAMLLLSACAGALGPASSAPAEDATAEEAESAVPTPEVTREPVAWPNAPETQIAVNTVDEFLEALGPDRVILLPEGELNLTEASDYGDVDDSAYYDWVPVYEGWELRICLCDNLYISGVSAEESKLVTRPRYANVLRFDSCSNVNVIDLTVGHTIEKGACSGGVLYFDSCSNVNVMGDSLYGCGVVAVTAENCRGVNIQTSELYECSNGAVEVRGCYDVRIQTCRIHDNGGDEWDSMGYQLFDVSGTTGFAVFDSEIANNRVRVLLQSQASLEVLMANCLIQNNEIGEEPHEGTDANGNPYTWSYGAVFSVSGKSPVITGCAFVDNKLNNGWYFNWADSGVSGVCVNEDGKELQEEDFLSMERAEYGQTYLGPHVPEQPAAPTGEIGEDGRTVYHVDNVDDFLAAIGSDTVIYLESSLFDFSTAANYGGYGGDHYYWVDLFDGPGLVISDVENLSIIGQGRDKTTLQATPRYAEVLYFDSCKGISIEDLTAGHLKEAPGSCAGDVFEFLFCENVSIQNCGLFGCGVTAIVGSNCSDFTVSGCELYECSSSGLSLDNCRDFLFTDCLIRNCPSGGYLYNVSGIAFENCRIENCSYNAISLNSGRNCSFNGAAMGDGNNFDQGVGYTPPTEPEAQVYNDLEIRYYTVTLTEFTLRVGDDPVPLTAWMGDENLTADATWSTSNGTAVDLVKDENGQVTLTPLKPVPGGVTIYAQYENFRGQVTVYIPN